MTNQQIAEKYIEARKAYKEAEAILAEAKLAIEQALATSETKRVETKDGVVSVITVNNRVFDVVKLKNLIQSDTFNKVTEVKVNVKAFTEAENQGEISDKIIAEVVKIKAHSRVEVGEVVAH